MANTMTMLEQPAKLRRAAKLLSQSADAMAEARKAALANDPPTITPGDFKLSILHENSMRDALTTVLLQAIDSTIQGIQGSQADLEKAITEASDKISKLNDIKKAFAVFASLIGLAQAIVTASPGGIIDALSAVQQAAS